MKKTMWLLLALVLLVALVVPTSCNWNLPCLGNPSIQVVKYVSVDHGVTWYDANSSAEGPIIYEGQPLKYKFVVTNTGDVQLTNITLTDSNYDLKTFDTTVIVSPLAAGGSFSFEIGYGAPQIHAVQGYVKNTVTATGDYNGVTYKDTDVAWYHCLP